MLFMRVIYDFRCLMVSSYYLTIIKLYKGIMWSSSHDSSQSSRAGVFYIIHYAINKILFFWDIPKFIKSRHVCACGWLVVLH